MIRLLIWFPLTLAAAAECIAVTGDKIVAGDLAAAMPEFVPVPQDAVLSFAPIPGSTRNFKSSEIAMLARRFQVALPAGGIKDVCFVSAAAVLTEDQIRAAILAAIPMHVAALKILDFSRSRVPRGSLEFRVAGLTRSSSNPPATIWQGRMATGSGRSFPVWAKLEIVVDAKIVVSAKELEKNHTLTTEDAVYAEQAPFPFARDQILSLDQALGQTTLRTIAEGSPLGASMLEQPREVIQGQVVRVESICGEARLSFEARAQMSGHHGDVITVQNPNGRSFRARVTDKGRVEVRSSAGD